MRTPITKISSSLSLTCLSIVAGFLVACDRSEPHSYEIPKETREVIIPSKSVTAKVAPSDPKSTSSGMQVLPGMAEAAQAAAKKSKEEAAAEAPEAEAPAAEAPAADAGASEAPAEEAK